MIYAYIPGVAAYIGVDAGDTFEYFSYLCETSKIYRTMKYNFDKIVERRGTSCVKWDALQEHFGRTDLTPLWVADMDFEVCPEITEALRARVDHRVYGYGCPADGYWQSIIDWQRNMHGFTFSREELCYVPGVVKGIAFALNYFTDKGDKVVIQEPVYHPFRAVAQGNGRVVVNNALRAANGFYCMDIEGLERIFAAEHPRMMILCNPHNPIGITWSRETLVEVASLAKKYGVIVVSDEIHGDLALFGHEHIPFATVSDEAADVAVTFGAPSKTFNIPGLVSSWCVVKNPALRSGFFGWLAANEFSDPTFVATIATETAYKCGSAWLDSCKAYIENNILAVEEFCAKRLPGVRPVRPQASFLVWLDCSALGMSHDKLIATFVGKAHLALNDGTIFGAGGENCMRLNVATPRASLLKALNALEAALNA